MQRRQADDSLLAHLLKPPGKTLPGQIGKLRGNGVDATGTPFIGRNQYLWIVLVSINIDPIHTHVLTNLAQGFLYVRVQFTGGYIDKSAGYTANNRA
jgi:hypothetical protein